MKYVFIGLLLIVGALEESYCQKYIDRFHLRNYQYSLTLELNDKTESGIYVFSDYGGQKSFASKKEGDNYLYQSQEYENNLGLYLYSSRVYHTPTKRFFQPDPKSQYASSYLFVGADPINFIDRDGNEGRPLVLYGETDGKMSYAMNKTSIPNGHYYPLSDFVQGKVPTDLPEWDGNVYIQAHMYTGETAQIEVERASSVHKIKSRSIDRNHVRWENRMDAESRKQLNAIYNDDPNWLVSVDSKYIGQELKKLSINNKTGLNNVVFAGCEGEDAAYHAAEGFRNAESASFLKGQQTHFFGTKKGYDLIEEVNPLGYNHTSWSWIPADIPDEKVWRQAMKYEGKEFDGWMFEEANGEKLPAYFNPEDQTVEDMLYHGRMSNETSEMVSHFVRDY